jgi:hypothetical protein
LRDKPDWGRIQKGIATLVLGLSALALAAAVVLLVMPAVEPSVPVRTADLERGVAASSARYQALARYYGAKTANLERSAAASAARWNGLAATYAADRERAAAASSARYQALADWYAKQATSGE